MAKPNTCLILNPASGSGRNAEQIRRLAKQHDWLELLETTPDISAAHRTQQALERQPRTLIISGGDGTIHSAIQPLASHPSPPSIAVIPAGTANDLATSLNIPTEPTAALSLIASNHTRAVDLIDVHDAHTNPATDPPRCTFINAATGGFAQIVSDRLDPDLKQTWGPLAYLRAAIESAADPPLFNLTIAINDEQREGKPHSGKAHAVVLANGPRAGGFTLAPSAQPDDQLLDLLILTPVDFADQLRLSAQFAIGQHTNDQCIIHRRVASVTIESDPPITFSCDGEQGPTTPATFTLRPAALRIFLPTPIQ